MNLQLPATGQLSGRAAFDLRLLREERRSGNAGLQRLAGRGNCLAPAWRSLGGIFDRAELATGDIVEDLKLGQDWAAQGHRPMFVEQARVFSGAESDRNTLSQRRRWEGGFLAQCVRGRSALLAQSLREGDIAGDLGGVEPDDPAVALLVLLDSRLSSPAHSLGYRRGRLANLRSGGAPGLAFVAIALAWLAGGSQFVTSGALARAPSTSLWKIPMYLALSAPGRRQEWQRTERSWRGGTMRRGRLTAWESARRKPPYSNGLNHCSMFRNRSYRTWKSLENFDFLLNSGWVDSV